MEVTDEYLVEFLVIVDRDLNCLERAVVTLNVEMVAQGLSTSCESVEDEVASFPEGERVSFDGVRVVV